MKIYYSNNELTAYLMRDVRKRDAEGDCPLRWCITYRRQRVYYSSGKMLNGKDWEVFDNANEKDFVNGNAKHLKELKDDLTKYFEDTLKPIIRDLSGNFSFDALNRKLGRSDITTVNDAFNSKIAALSDAYKVGNAGVYLSTIKALMRFKHYKGLRSKAAKELFIDDCINKKHNTRGKNVLSVTADIYFDDITVKFLNDCENFWAETGIKNATIGIYMRTLRAVINNKGDDPYLTGNKYPFGENKYQIPEGSRRNIALPIEDIWKIEDFQSDNQSLIFARDIFVFMFYCNGLNFGDLCRMQYKDIDSATGEIKFIRKKTRDTGKKGSPQPIYAPLLPPMIEIINRHGNDRQEGYIFPILNGIERLDKNESQIKKAINLGLIPLNNALKVIAAQLGLDGNLSTAYARNSYVTHLISELYISEIFVKQMVGHSTAKNVTAGYNNPTPKKRREINSKLMNPQKQYNTINTIAITG